MNSKELLTKFLNEIGWTLKPCGCEHYRIQDHEQNDTDYMLWSNAITARGNNTTTGFIINVETVRLIGDDTVCIGTDDHSVLFMGD